MRQILLLGGLAAVLVVGGTDRTTASHTGLYYGAPSRVTVMMTEYAFSPRTITLEAGSPVDLVLENKGILPHILMVYAAPKKAPQTQTEWWEYVIANTYLRDMGEILVRPTGGARAQANYYVAATRLVEVGVDAGQTVTVTLVPTRKGTFEIGCHVGSGPSNHYTRGMRGTLIVR